MEEYYGWVVPAGEPISENERKFAQKLIWHSQLINLIESTNLKEYALTFVPAEDLKIKATQTLSMLNDGSCIEDFLILELLEWFKYYFFSWVDTPKCDKCKKNTENRGFVEPTQEEAAWFAKSVENYFCSACNIYVRFPRYNHPRKLLETRKGRCGEWGICFTLICRAMDLDVRLVIDWTDHLWTEMYSPSLEKWIHCDPCEDVCNQPLLYEEGWKKKLYLIIAFSKDEVQDVTWRYSRNFAEILKRRSEFQFREDFILSWITYLTFKCRSKSTEEKLRFLEIRQTAELAELLTPPKINDETLGGRTSGSAAWRLARKEISAESVPKSYVFNLSDIEVEKRYFHIRYSIAQDEYIRVSDNESRYESWKACTFFSKRVFRKVEADWKMAYLAREEEFSMGKIVWKFDFQNSGLMIHRLMLHLIGTTFHDGKVKWSIVPVKLSGEHFEKISYTSVYGQFSDEKFKGAVGLVISAELFGGSGQQAWQHAQLFRQPLECVKFPFEVEIHFKKL